uniref:Sulfhydryl oxidase n=1 Tax=Trichuris muris TaxID=70415 RepID=A0A5S6Q5A8_TRIMR
MAIYSRENPAQSIYTSRSALNLEFALEVIKMYCLVGPKNTEVKTRPQLTTNFVAPKEQLTGDDLRSAVMHLLPLKKFIQMLQEYYPKADSVVKTALQKLNKWLMEQKEHVTSDQWHEKIAQLKAEYQLPKETKWVTCQGSKIYYRGYSCGLWMLFHTVTVEAYLKDGNKTDFEPTSVPETINEYMQHFFSCRECADHFGEAAANISSEVTRPEDVVLWLWKAHNRANGFLRGTPSEDPSHPKVQFPTKDLCQSCYTANGQWEEGGVFEFLTGFYRLGVCN